MAAITPQPSGPSGQHNTVVFPANGIHVVPSVQQKSFGSPACGHLVEFGSLHVPSRSKRGFGLTDMAVDEVANIAASIQTRSPTPYILLIFWLCR